MVASVSLTAPGAALRFRLKRSWLPRCPGWLLARVLRHRPWLLETLEVFRAERGFDVFGEIAGVLRPLGYRMCDLTADGVLVDVGSGGLPPNTLGVPEEHPGGSPASTQISGNSGV